MTWKGLDIKEGRPPQLKSGDVPPMSGSKAMQWRIQVEEEVKIPI